MSNLIFFRLLLILFFTLSPIAHPNETVESEIKQELEHNLKNDYLKKLELSFGECGDQSSSCLQQKDDYMTVNLPKKEMCFPYTMCGFYHCMENTYHCSEVNVPYFTELAFPTCSAYQKNISKNRFSNVGVKWIYNVMVCLQKGLVDECFVKGNCPSGETQQEQKKTCDHITDFTLAYHPGCYINSGVGVCHLPLSDKINIWKTVSPFMTKTERREAYKVIFKCLRPASVKRYFRKIRK